MNSHSLTNFTVNRNHVTTIVSQIEVLLFLARDLGSSWCWCWCRCPRIATQHLVCIRGSSNSGIWANHCHRILDIAKLRHLGSSHRNFHLSLPLDQSSPGNALMQLLCPGSYSPILSFQVKMSFTDVWYVCSQSSCHQHHSVITCIHPNPRAVVPFVRTPS